MKYLQEQRRNHSKLILPVPVIWNNLINFSIIYSIPTFTQFGRIETSDELFKLATRILPLKEKHAVSAIKWLKVMSHDDLLNLIFFSFYS